MRRMPKRTNCSYLSCPYCRKVLGGTKEYTQIPTFPKGKGLYQHIEICKYKRGRRMEIEQLTNELQFIIDNDYSTNSEVLINQYNKRISELKEKCEHTFVADVVKTRLQNKGILTCIDCGESKEVKK